MRTSASLMAGTALAASFGLHLAGFMMLPTPEIKIAGGATQQVVMLGNSFVDMSAGTISPPETTQTTDPVDEAMPVKTPPVITTALAVVVSQSNPVVPLLTTPIAATPAVIMQAPVKTTIEPPKTEATIALVKPLKTLTAEVPVEVQQAKPQTPRPVTRPTKPVATPPPKPQGAQAATRGLATGSTTGQAASSSRQGSRSTAAGNAAVSNYPGQVMRKISRIRKQRAGARGKATVGFKISSSGAATSVRILRSSGSAKIDRIAIRHIQRASPFLRPPKGARRNFSVVFVSKG